MPRLRCVALSAPFLDPGRSGGTETYLRGLVPALAAERPEVRLTLLTTRRGAAALRRDGWDDLCELVALPADEGQRVRRLVGEQVLAPRAAVQAGADLLHALANVAPVRARLPVVVTVHDVIPFLVGTSRWTTTVAARVLTWAGVRTAQAVLVPTHASAAEVVRVLRPPGRVTVVSLGAGRPAGPALPPAVVRQRLAVPEHARVVLCVGALRPHKGQALLVAALPHLPDDVVLVLVGVHEPYVDRVRRTAQALGVAARVRLPGYVDDDLLEGLWRTASAAALPTTAEGFGLPLLEALDRGLPVAASDLPVLREVGGDLPHWFASSDAEDTARAVAAALAAVRDERGRQHAAAYDWRATAARTLDAYERVLAEHT